MDSRDIRTFVVRSGMCDGNDLCVDLVSALMARGFCKSWIGCRWIFMVAMKQYGKVESRDSDAEQTKVVAFLKVVPQ